jgi:hypothetical protein
MSHFYTKCAILPLQIYIHSFLDCSIESNDFQEASGDENEADKDRSIEKWGNPEKPSWLSLPN